MTIDIDSQIDPQINSNMDFKAAIEFLFKQFLSVYQSNDTHKTLEIFCKILKTHHEKLGFFVQYHDTSLLDNWLTKSEDHCIFTINRLDSKRAEILFSKPLQIPNTLFNVIKDWQQHFSHETFKLNTHDTLSERFDEAHKWINHWMSQYLDSYLLDDLHKELTIKSPKLSEHQLIQAVGIQQSLQFPLAQWNKQDSTWWQNIAPSALAISLLSHNINNQHAPVQIEFDALTSQNNSNIQHQFEQLLNSQPHLIESPSSAMQLLFLNFEINCLNACTFFRPYKLLYAIKEFKLANDKLVNNPSSHVNS